ncbi:hypothetical protein PHJA_000780400 [Phtheirospermum japonicum]|uniref:Uncharacterized protein n=1 Tax=Phtheirospermum japonicum TaxID=374723 RepID=A0A830BHJ2_9LAMI|nr:hypothetical protein PHJA_000780400 [Phtheirospermum japonicum]
MIKTTMTKTLTKTLTKEITKATTSPGISNSPTRRPARAAGPEAGPPVPRTSPSLQSSSPKKHRTPSGATYWRSPTAATFPIAFPLLVAGEVAGSRF